MIFFALQFVRSPKKCNVHLCQKVPFVFACFQASTTPLLENPDSDEKDALLALIRKYITIAISR
jgi:hypothetical protein